MADRWYLDDFTALQKELENARKDSGTAPDEKEDQTDDMQP